MGVSGVKRITPDITIEEQIALLRQHDEETQGAINDLAGRVDAIEQGTSRRFEESQAAMEGYVADALATARLEYRALRIAGAVLLLIGLGLSTAGNLVG